MSHGRTDSMCVGGVIPAHYENPEVRGSIIWNFMAEPIQNTETRYDKLTPSGSSEASGALVSPGKGLGRAHSKADIIRHARPRSLDSPPPPDLSRGRSPLASFASPPEDVDASSETFFSPIDCALNILFLGPAQCSRPSSPNPTCPGVVYWFVVCTAGRQNRGTARRGASQWPTWRIRDTKRL